MSKKMSIRCLLWAVMAVLFFIVPLQADKHELGPQDISRALGVNIITKPGFYFISRTFASNLKIRSSNVVLELAGNTVTGGIDIGTNLENVTIQNGIIDGNNALSDGIKANAGTQKIILKDLQIKNSARGITFDNVADGLVANCELTLNDTGADLTDCQNITIENTIASRNKFTGFGMLRSSTCTFQECKAISTGHGVTALDQDVFGFVSSQGSANIFERCIANSTQGLTVTGFGSMIAGFALRESEQCSKIIDCEAANAASSPNGVTVPYGILVQAVFDEFMSITAVNPDGGNTTDTIIDDAWSPDGKYVVVGGSTNSNTGNNLFIYRFDYPTEQLVEVIAARPSGSANDFLFGMAWSPDSNYLAVVSQLVPFRVADDFIIYRFDSTNETITKLQGFQFSESVTGIYKVAWHPNGQYMAVGLNVSGSAPGLKLLRFDSVAQQATLKQSINLQTDDNVQTVAWSPDGQYLAVGGDMPIDDLRLYFLNRESEQLVEVDTKTNGGSVTRNADWSPDGHYLAVSGQLASDEDVRIYKFNRDTQTLDLIVSFAPTNSLDIFKVSWSRDGRYLAIGGRFSTTTPLKLRMLEFDAGVPSLTQIDAIDPDGAGTAYESVRGISWTPDGQYLAVAGVFTNTDDLDFYIYKVLATPSKNVIKGNTVYCNSGGTCPSGVGISASSIANLVIQNTAYSNPIPQDAEGGGPIVFSNYQLVANVFNPLFQTEPTGLQNVSVNPNDPIAIPAHLSLLIKQTKEKACSVSDLIDETISRADGPMLTVSTVCGATPIAGGPIVADGFYCLAQDVAGGLAINASNVALDLNGRKVSGGITFTNRDFVKIFNGIVEGTATTDGITATNGSNITLANVTIKNARVGANLNTISGATIAGCSFISNTTGTMLINATNITIDDSAAINNTHAGFDLINSTTNCLRDCKALSTGEGNANVLNQTVFGFVSSNGYGNIFERCIANSTQALSTTDYDSVIAGFALRGTEQCSKIIECEAANAMASADGVTVPHGILLEATLNQLVTVTSSVAPAGPTSADWSPDAKYLAVADFGGSQILVYQFDRISNSLAQVASDSSATSPNSADWSPDGKYLAVADFGGSQILVYQFNRISNSLAQVASDSSAISPNSSDWSPDGKYLAVADSGGGGQIFVYQFDRSSNSLVQVVSNTTFTSPQSSDWSPDGKYLAVADSGGGGQIFVYQFDRSSNSLVQVASNTTSTSPQSSDWSPDGKYIGVADFGGGGQVLVYQFDRGSNSLIQVASDTAPTLAESSNWSPDGKYIGVADFGGGGQVLVYQFDRGSNSLIQVASDTAPTLAIWVDWIPDGSYLALVDNSGQVLIYAILTFPTKNVIKNNTVYCNSTGGDCPRGVGISGSSIANLIIQNTSYSNPIGPVGGISQNYNFVTNVFNQQLQNAPTLLQNIAIGCDEPICTPDNTALLIQQACAKVDTIAACGPTAISSADVTGSSGIVSLTESGNYCLAEDVSALFVVSGDGISLDLNDHCLNGQVQLSTGNDIVLKNGTVVFNGGTSSGSVIEVNADRALIDNVVVVSVSPSDSDSGVRFNGSADSQISNCTILTGDGVSDASPVINRAGIKVRGSSSDIVIRDCVIKTGNGGYSTGAAAGGDGGDGIRVDDGSGAVNRVEIFGCTIMSTGSGGDSASGAGGRGGHGIHIGSAANDVSVRNCTIANTGFGGTGTSQGLPGKAVLDLVTVAADESQIFKNFAHHIANSTKFDLQSPSAGPEDGIFSPNPPDGTILNPWANIFTIP